MNGLCVAFPRGSGVMVANPHLTFESVRCNGVAKEHLTFGPSHHMFPQEWPERQKPAHGTPWPHRGSFHLDCAPAAVLSRAHYASERGLMNHLPCSPFRGSLCLR